MEIIFIICSIAQMIIDMVSIVVNLYGTCKKKNK